MAVARSAFPSQNVRKWCFGRKARFFPKAWSSCWRTNGWCALPVMFSHAVELLNRSNKPVLGKMGNFWGEAAEATNRAGITAKRQRGPGRRGGGGPSREATPTHLLSVPSNASWLALLWRCLYLALSVMSLKRLRRNGKARQKPASPTQMVVAAAQHGLRLCWLASMRLWDLPHHCCKHLMTLKLVWSALSAGITAPDIILRDFNAQLFEPSRDRIHRPTRPIKIRWPRATDKYLAGAAAFGVLCPSHYNDRL